MDVRTIGALVVGVSFACGGISEGGSPSSTTFASFQVVVLSDSGADGQCMPYRLHVEDSCTVQCSALVLYFNQTDQSAGCTDPGMAQPDMTTLAAFQNEYRASLGDANTDPLPVACTYRQLSGGAQSSVQQESACANAQPDYQGISCESDPNAPAGWCYVVGAANTGSGCPQSIEATRGGPPLGTSMAFTCVVQ
jgi:hypothetical protein